MYGVQNNLVPENILNMFQKVTYTHKYRTQSNASWMLKVYNTQPINILITIVPFQRFIIFFQVFLLKYMLD